MAQLNFRNATLIGAVLISTMSNSVTANPVISLDDVIIQAITNDPWVNGNNQKYRATLARSSAVATMSDPLVSVSLMNVPVDSMDFNQENMTQLKVGVSQLLPRGNVLDIKQAKLTTSAQKYPLMQEERKAQLTLNVTHIWLDIYLAQKTINLITRDKTLFEQTADVARASYSSTVGKTRQQDVIRSQLELIQLDDRLTVEYQKLESAIARLNEWLHVFQDGLHDNRPNFDAIATDIKVTDSLPSIPLRSNILSKNKLLSRNSLAQLVSNHPTVRLIDVDQKVALKDVEIAKEQYKPQWGINASYAYRDAMENGDDRADFFPLGLLLMCHYLPINDKINLYLHLFPTQRPLERTTFY
ncbi:TolC family protein [Psychrosphaera algicola]|uniref:TolC family protein n=1 Tax=Psychrosphaera algicola TaxID=3023714 RepID=A0ABT5F8I2_9GAMM|nr:TolC family protein [Psychrosphaera sp. G1-22]MDC2887850.1 TolC family protein [Psychrosphaera sp. G1-22]